MLKIFGLIIIRKKDFEKIKDKQFVKGYLAAKATTQFLKMTKTIMNLMFGLSSNKYVKDKDKKAGKKK